MPEKFLENLVEKHPMVLVDFSATWCEPCKWAFPIVQDIKNHFGEKLHLEIVDIDEHPEVARILYVLSVPTLVLFKDGKEVWRMRGFDVATKLIAAIGEYINRG